MPIDALLGIQWGDEGKGKIVDLLAKDYEIILRFQGGNNAGHTLYLPDGTKVVLHLIPSGIFHLSKINLIGPGVVLDPVVFKEELDNLAKLGVDYRNRLFVSGMTPLIMPYHKLLDSMCCGKIGTTGRGIGPAYEDLIGRRAIRLIDVVRGSRASLKVLLDDLLPMKNAVIKHYGGEPISTEEMVDFLMQYKALFMNVMMEDMTGFLLDKLHDGVAILAEGAQGTLLDVLHGTYRFNTSSFVTISGLNAYCGIPPKEVRRVFGVFKAYITRVGNGPFPTELFNGTGDMIRKAGKEFGSTTGRPRRCGWLDLPLLKYACDINGVTDLIMTKADVMAVLDEFLVNGTYQVDGAEINHFYPSAIERMKAANEFRMAGFKDIRDPEFEDYLHLIEDTVMPVSMVSHGPGRDEVVTL